MVRSLWVWVSVWADGAGAGRAAFSWATEVEGLLGAASEPLHQLAYPSSHGDHSAFPCPTVALLRGTGGGKASQGDSRAIARPTRWGLLLLVPGRSPGGSRHVLGSTGTARGGFGCHRTALSPPDPSLVQLSSGDGRAWAGPSPVAGSHPGGGCFCACRAS